jgi:hypothetical protein
MFIISSRNGRIVCYCTQFAIRESRILIQKLILSDLKDLMLK